MGRYDSIRTGPINFMMYYFYLRLFHSEAEQAAYKIEQLSFCHQQDLNRFVEDRYIYRIAADIENTK